MKIDIETSRIGLEEGQTLPLVDANHYSVACHDGRVWITQDDELKDIVLSPGETMEITHPGTTVVNACQSAVIRVLPPAKQASIFRVAAHWLHEHGFAFLWHEHGGPSGSSPA